MIASPSLSAPSPADLAWSAAAERVKSYLRAHRVASSRQVNRLAVDIIAIARARHRKGQDPTAVAMETLEASMRAWFGRLLPTGEAAAANTLTRGRIALAMGEVPSRWPEYFLRDAAAPAELIRLMRASESGRLPEIRLSHMAPPKPAARSIARGASQTSRWPLGWMMAGVRAVVSFVGAALAGGR